MTKTALESMILRYFSLQQQISALKSEQETLRDEIKAAMTKAKRDEMQVGEVIAVIGQRINKFYCVTKELATILVKSKVEALVPAKIIDDAIKSGTIPSTVAKWRIGKAVPYFTVRSVSDKEVFGE